MRYFQVDLRDYPTEYGFMPSLQLYLVEKNDTPRPIVIIAPGGGYTMLAEFVHLPDKNTSLCKLLLSNKSEKGVAIS